MHKKRIDIITLKQIKDRSIFSDIRKISSPKDAYDVFNNFVDFKELDREMFILLCLNTKNEPSHISVISIGSLNSSIVHPREVFKTALMCNSASIIVAHNHPSGNPDPSQEDVDLTKRLSQCGKILGIELLDHIIIGGDDFISLKSKNMLIA